jgi:hypothetical protein
MQMLQNSDQGGTQGGLVLNHRLKTLRELATTLLSEVEEISRVRALDIKSGINIYDEMRRYEVELIRRALKLTSGNQARAAFTRRASAERLRAAAGNPKACERKGNADAARHGKRR